ncbi:MAG: hypothetical protein U0K81_01150 [Paludibacteraceae bacterium]|jgi:hypothetical protein|nr:hypothetical protein [Paludibacteraceae bacterium]
MKDIRIDIGVCTALDIDLSTVDFTAIKAVIFTVKNYPVPDAPEVIERVFTEPGIHEVVITPEESLALKTTAEYDFCTVLEDGKRFKLTDNGKVVLRKAVGDCIDD